MVAERFRAPTEVPKLVSPGQILFPGTSTLIGFLALLGYCLGVYRKYCSGSKCFSQIRTAKCCDGD